MASLRNIRGWKLAIVMLAVVLALGAGAFAWWALHGGAGVLRTYFGGSNAAIELKFADVPAYTGVPSVAVHDNKPYFSEEELSLAPFETYSKLDSRGRCGQAYALVGPETMPDGERGDIGSIKPSGWQIARYDWIDGGYLFNRCHLIAFALAGENDNPQNLITGTRSLNVQGMLPFEERVARYIDKTQNHVLYRVTPLYDGRNLVASGVVMEAESVEDRGAGISFCVWCYNVEPGVVIDYATGSNRTGDPVRESFGRNTAGVIPGGLTVPEEDGGEADEAATESAASADSAVATYVLNTNSRRFHRPDCASVGDIAEKNKRVFEGSRDELIEQGYQPCGACNP